jgi:hypothetical protein
LLTRCDGTKTGADLFEELKRDNAIHADTAAAVFADVLRTLVSGGFSSTPRLPDSPTP